MSNSTHRCEVVPVALRPHPNADSLSVVSVWDYTCVVRTEDWQGINKAVWIPPDNLVDVRRPEFSFLATQANDECQARIRAKKLRGIVSFGLLVPAPEEATLGEDWAERLGVTHYDPPLPGDRGERGGLFVGGECAKSPNLYFVKYDLEAGRRYAREIFTPGEPVVVTEKIHGCNGRYVFQDDVMYCGSRDTWKKEYCDYSHVTVESLAEKVGKERAEAIVEGLSRKSKVKNLWWQALDATPALLEFCQANPGTIVYGEVYGAVQDLNYGMKKGSCAFVAFDLMKDGRWLDWGEARILALTHNLPWVPILDPHLPFDFDRVCQLAEGHSLIPGANHVREGVVVRSLRERHVDRVGRACLKFVGAGYLERSKSKGTGRATTLQKGDE